jgi:hypothetical protein
MLLAMKSPQSGIEAPIKALIEAIRNLHGCKAVWIESVPIKETFRGNTVWEGEVQVFELIDHPTTTRCYSWFYDVEATSKRRFFAVLHQDPVNSPQAAVRAAIVAEVRQKKS